MARTKIEQGIVERIELLWAEDPKQTATRVWERYKGERGWRGAVGLRKVQYIVADAKDRAEDREFPTAEWNPWSDRYESAEDTYYLLRLNEVSRIVRDRSLHQHEASWARRLRTASEGLNLYVQFWIADVYAAREVSAFTLDRELYTADIDAILAYRPWIPENRVAYEWDLGARNIPPPFSMGHLGTGAPEAPGAFAEFANRQDVPRLVGRPSLWGISHWSLGVFQVGEQFETAIQGESADRVETEVLLRFWAGIPDYEIPVEALTGQESE